MGHCQPVIALIADENFPAASDQEFRKAVPMRDKSVPLQCFEKPVDPLIILSDEPGHCGFAADAFPGIEPPPIEVAEQVRFFPRFPLLVAFEDGAILCRGFDRMPTLDVPIPSGPVP